MPRSRTSSALDAHIARILCLVMLCLTLLPLSRSMPADALPGQEICSASKSIQADQNHGLPGSHAHNQHCDACWQPLGMAGVAPQPAWRATPPSNRIAALPSARPQARQPWTHPLAHAPPFFT
ncbi:MAG: hypothetical protein ACLGI6_00285 [Gammaproteobacteria bacterium]